MLYISIAYLLAYLIGGIPNSYIAGRLRGIDIREHGSGNVGATNALRVLGTKTGVIVMLLDAFKGIVAILLGSYLVKLGGSEASQLIQITLGLSAIVGHVFSIYLKFKGGKGVATAAGVYGFMTPYSFLIALLVFIFVVWRSRYVSLGSILAATTLMIAEIVRNVMHDFEYKYILIFTVLVCGFIIIKHKSNISRLMKGNENKINFKK
jgi:glycerol-3-phosphate acyltransferase PlsY